MCGIVGLHLTGRALRRADLDAMNETIVHRGPDGEGAHVDGSFGIGMRRLSIIDLEGGWQPIPNETETLQVVQNGELYNFPPLRRELEARGHRFRTQSDTEVAVHAYEEWGGWEFPSHLRGMFAIAVWDAERRELWVARDRLGIKPLYYARTPAGFAFASEVKALLKSPVVPPRIEPRTLAQYLAYGSAGIEDSFVQDVHQLPPGHVLRYDGTHLEVRPYWSFRFPEPLRISEEEAREALEHRLRETVKLHLLSDVPVGAFLSGGIDSSAMVGLMAEAGAQGFKTFSIGFDEAAYNELPYARQVAERWGCEHHEEVVRPDAVEIIDELIHHLDEPFADASAIPTWYVARLAARHVKVAISGDGGDELFAGYTRYAKFARAAGLDRIPRFARRLGAALGRVVPQGFPGKYFLQYAALDARERYAFQLDLFPRPLRQQLLRPEWRPERLGIEDPSRDRVRLMESSHAPDPMSECMYLDTLRYLPQDILVKVDRTTMAHSLEARPPLLDHEFVEFAASLPIGLKYSAEGRTKHILKEAVRPLLPEGLLDRPKAGFAVPLQEWFAGPLESLFRDTVLADGRCLAYLDARCITDLFDESQRRRRDHGLRLWAILVLELWMRGL